MRRLAKIISTFFYLGYFPKIPGTAASLIACLLFIFLKNSPLLLFIISAFLLSAGFLFTAKAEKIFQKKDAPEIVIDEVAGMLLTFCLLVHIEIKPVFLFTIFLLFRLFDILKPYPIKYLQKLPGSIGIMSDDIAAAIYSAIFFQLFLKVTLWIGS